MKALRKIVFLTMIFLVCTSCHETDNKSFSSKYHSDQYLLGKNVFLLSDGTGVDCYEQSNRYYYLSDSEVLLLVANPVPPVWEYDEVTENLSHDALTVFKEEASDLTLYDLPALLEQAYKDYCEGTENFQNHVLFIDAAVSVDTSNIYCNYDLSYPESGHFTGDLEGTESIYIFDKNTGKLISTFPTS